MAAHEIMGWAPAAIRNLIREAKVAQDVLRSRPATVRGHADVDQNLTDLVRRNVISPAEARGQGEDSREFFWIRRRFRQQHLLGRAVLARPGGLCKIGAQRKAGASWNENSATKFINDLRLLDGSAANGSDLFITADFSPAIKVDGKVTKVSPQPLNPRTPCRWHARS